MSLFSLRISRKVALALGLLVLAAAFTGAALGQSGEPVVVAQDPGPAAPDVGTPFTYQGQLRNNGGLVNGECDFFFYLYSVSSGGSPIISEGKSAVPVSDGRFTVVLNLSNNFPTGQDRWLEVRVRCPAGSGSYESLGRQQLTATPYALTANNADTLDGYHAGTIQNSHTHFGQTNWNGSAGYGLYLDNNNSSGHGIYSEAGSIGLWGNGGDWGVYGDGGTSSNDYGGYFTGYTGVYGTAQNVGGYGVYGVSFNTNYSGGAVRALNNSTTTGVAIYAQAQSGDNNSLYGVWGTADFVGLLGTANRSTTHYGVYGSAVSSNGGYGVYSAGNMNVSGTLSKSAGSFKIDHPQDPKNKYLSHSFVESPDMMNVYNGNVTLDANGAAWVELPDYFEALNIDYRYQLTSIGAPGPNLYIAAEIADNRFQISGGEPGAKVSWQVTGIRNDPYAQANRIQVEEDKPDAERGTLRHPEVYGEPIEMGLDYQIGPQAVQQPEAVTPDGQ